LLQFGDVFEGRDLLGVDGDAVVAVDLLVKRVPTRVLELPP
jgi:hypothetical protein